MNKLDIINLTKRYGDFKEEATFSVPCGAVVGLIGENGAGKSTVIKSILGIVRPDGGRILFGGKEADKLTREERQKIAYVLDDTGLPDELTLKMLGTVLRNMFPTWNKGRFRSLIASLGLPESQPLKEFSKGMKMKAAIALSLIPEAWGATPQIIAAVSIPATVALAVASYFISVAIYDRKRC